MNKKKKNKKASGTSKIWLSRDTEWCFVFLLIFMCLLYFFPFLCVIHGVNLISGKQQHSSS